MPQVMAVAEFVTKLHAICMVCGTPANHSQRLTRDEDRVVLGATEAYEPRCRACFDPKMNQNTSSGTSRPRDSVDELIGTKKNRAGNGE